MSHVPSPSENSPSENIDPSHVHSLPSGAPANPELHETLLREKKLLQNQVDSQTEFIHLLLHQLATPLTSLQGSVHLLSEPSLDPAHRQEFLDLLHQQVHHLQEMLESLVALRSFEAGVLESQPGRFSLSSLVEEVTHLFHHATITYQFPMDLPDVWGDRWQVSQVLINLVSNAIKYSPAYSAIEIGATPIAEGWVEIWVRDHGLGIPTEAQPRLFERFYRVRHHDRANISGTGLGLSLCKLLIENQGGQIGFESTHGQGSRFFFTLPIA
ncbi:MAG: HAMP domain-containing histidine kinase [Leptolyngbyaceae cyanobacterium CSU_1_3]|nr:HAMP domain-containing histidine kinase [Leptolyngbyaceae cyanobacterium CSU_1_3]